MTTPPDRTPDHTDPDADPPPGEPAHPGAGGSPYQPSGSDPGSRPDHPGPGGSAHRPGGDPPHQPGGGSPYQPGWPGSPYQPGGGWPGPPSGQPPYDWGAYPPPPGAPGAGQFGGPGGGPWGQPTRKRSNRVVFVLIGVLVAVLVVLVGAYGVLRNGGSPRETADKFLTALQAKDVDKARELLCSDGKRKKSASQLRSDFELDAHTITSYVITGDSNTRQRDSRKETLVDATLTYETGDNVPVQIGVWNEGGQKICSLQPPAGK